MGRAGFGLGVDARQVAAPHADVPLAAQALRADAAVSRDFTVGDPSPLAPLAAHVKLERVLVVPMRSLEREVGVLVFNRPQDAGEYSGEQVALAEGLARYVARHRGQRAPAARAQHAPPRPRARPRLESRLRPEPRHGRGARGGRHAARRRARHARLRHLRGRRRRRRHAQPRQLRRRRLRQRRVARPGVPDRLLRHQRHGHPQPPAGDRHVRRRPAAQLRRARPHAALGAQHPAHPSRCASAST